MKQNMLETYSRSQVSKFLEGDPYPGRGIVCGYTPDGKKAVSAYFIMGRSQNSRNRVFVETGNDLMIKPFDESKVGDPSLIIYYPLRVEQNHLIVTNGDQTDTIRDFVREGKSFKDALDTREFEPDAPNYTPRISAMFDLDSDVYHMSILKAGDPEGNTCSRYYFDYEKQPGCGTYIHTYETDGSPIPTYIGEPERVEITKDIDEFTSMIWDALDKDNRISLYVRYTDLKTGNNENRLINKYSTDR